MIDVMESHDANDITVTYLPEENTVTIGVWRGNDVTWLVVNSADAIRLASKLQQTITG